MQFVIIELYAIHHYDYTTQDKFCIYTPQLAVYSVLHTTGNNNNTH